MTGFVNDDGEYLDYSGPDVGLSKQCANFYEFKIKGDVSVTIKLDNNSQNRKALGYYGAQQEDSPAFTRIQFSMTRDGNVISRGVIVINSSDEKQIECFYLSGNSNWFQGLQFNLKEVDYDDSLTSNWDTAATKSATSGIIFPMVDWFAKGQKRGNTFVIVQNPTEEDFPLISEIHPMVYLHTIVEEMGKYSGSIIGGDLITDALFKKIVLTNDGPELYFPDRSIEISKLLVESANSVYNSASDPQKIQFNNVISGNVNLIDTATYTLKAPIKASYRIELDLRFSPASLYQVDYYLNGAGPNTILNMTLVASSAFVVVNIGLVKGDEIYFQITKTSGGGTYRLTVATQRTRVNWAIKRLIGSTQFIPIAAIVPDMKAIDLIKFFAFYFSCVITYDEYKNKIYINQLKNFRKEEAEDWSEFFVSADTDFHTGVSRKNYIQGGEGEEEQIVAFNAQSRVRYGGGTINLDAETDFEEDRVIKEERTIFEIPFAGSWDQANSSGGLRWFLPYIKFYDVQLTGDPVSYSAVTNVGGFAQFTATFQDLITQNTVFYIKSVNGLYTGFAILYTANGASSGTTNPAFFGIGFSITDTGTIFHCDVSKVTGNPRMLLCYPNKTLTDAGGPTTADIASETSTSTAALAWFDKPPVNAPIDGLKETLAVDSLNNNNSISELNYGVIKSVFNNAKIDALFRLPAAVFQSFNFGTYIYINTTQLTGYFIVQKIENYKDALTPVKVELLYAD